MPPPRATDIWEDLTAARMEAHVQSLEIGDLREAVSYLAGVVEALTNRVKDLERGTQ